jgi:hypothetical protein
VRTSTAADGVTEVTLRSPMPVSADALFAWHERRGASDRLTPAWMPVKAISREGGIRTGVRLAVPFALWEHAHTMEPAADGTSVLEDRIRYRLPAAPFGALVAGRFTEERLARLLRWRHAVTHADLERHAMFAARGPRRIAITGASGFLGDALVPFLTAGGHTVVSVGRDARSDVQWDPANGEIDAAALDSVDAVIHLAGASVAERWTDDQKRAIRDSRVQGTRLIAETCARMAKRPEVLVCGSAIGIYGSRGDEWLSESSALGDDFLAAVGREWEAAAAPALEAGIRVVFVRTGIVLNPGGGALAKMVTPFQFGVGGRLGSGKQWMSWISREDEIGALHFALQSPAMRGAVNLTAPEPVTNATFATTLGRVLHRPALASVPEFVLKTLFGEMAEGAILASQRVRPEVLPAAGFPFLHPSLSSALRFELGLL